MNGLASALATAARSAAGSNGDITEHARAVCPSYATDLGGDRSRVRRPTRCHLVAAAQVVIAAVMAASENGCAGHECRP